MSSIALAIGSALQMELFLAGALYQLPQDKISMRKIRATKRVAEDESNDLKLQEEERSLAELINKGGRKETLGRWENAHSGVLMKAS